ncbi:MAG: phage holin family protein, partial [Ruminococcaceae bacterium]|nr:phage holin family protein [Oscillospiraceae bacterium]
MSEIGLKNIILVAVSTVGGFLVDFTGGMDTVLKALLVFMAVDYLTGITVAFIFHKS